MASTLEDLLYGGGSAMLGEQSWLPNLDRTNLAAQNVANLNDMDLNSPFFTSGLAQQLGIFVNPRAQALNDWKNRVSLAGQDLVSRALGVEGPDAAALGVPQQTSGTRKTGKAPAAPSGGGLGWLPPGAPGPQMPARIDLSGLRGLAQAQLPPLPAPGRLGSLPSPSPLPSAGRRPRLGGAPPMPTPGQPKEWAGMGALPGRVAPKSGLPAMPDFGGFKSSTAYDDANPPPLSDYVRGDPLLATLLGRFRGGKR